MILFRLRVILNRIKIQKKLVLFLLFILSFISFLLYIFHPDSSQNHLIPSKFIIKQHSNTSRIRGNAHQQYPLLLIQHNRSKLQNDNEMTTIDEKHRFDGSLKSKSELGDARCIVFYYAWYGNPQFDGKWIHWKHEILDNSKRMIQPPLDIGSSYWPQLGLYSSRDPTIIESHMKLLQNARIGSLALSWWGRNQSSDSQGSITDEELVRLILDTALQFGIKVAVHLEPYPNRSANSVCEDLIYLNSLVFTHPSALLWNGRPLVFIYDHYLISEQEWKSRLDQFRIEQRGKELQPFLIGLLVEKHLLQSIKRSGFDGLYTYFASDGFTYGSTQNNWQEIQTFCRKNDLLFIPSIGPGYDDMKIRPWNVRNFKDRQNGTYYDQKWNHTLTRVNPQSPFISLTSFNEWHEGTQIEPCSNHHVTSDSNQAQFKTLFPLSDSYYLSQTSKWMQIWDSQLTKR
uniref:Uncharacterized protein n=1 Tax=Timspurckia oligopyrenoides TaxID=708627 RepID=A0A7S0ZIG9_9RHOD|mmetsp:Transcript_6643/g.11863  ORF Transcript_6643/g.11863 Transcript_6643/m.11863 type:complete len:457 (+) Transcript_6643:134-1504(+)